MKFLPNKKYYYKAWKKTINVIKKSQTNKCKTLVIVKCFSSSDIALLKILTSINVNLFLYLLKKHIIIIIAKGKIDLYEIIVNDEKINSFLLVLASVTGDVKL